MPIIGAKGSPSSGGFGQFAQSGAVNYIEEVFSAYLYTGTGAAQTITNGIDLSGQGGLVWVKIRSSADDHILVDTARGTSSGIKTNTTAAAVGSAGFTSFNTDGFSFGSAFNLRNDASNTYVSWTFRKQPKFFDVVTYTGNGAAGRNISHNLGSTPGCILVKRTDSTGDWWVYHVGANGGVNPQNYTAYLNTTGAFFIENTWSYSAPTSTTFRVAPTDASTNSTGATYVAYLFAHDAGGFGLTGTDNVISCGSYTGNGTTQSISLGYEPQWVLIKNVSSGARGFGSSWAIQDNMRGFPTSGAAQTLYADRSDAEDTNTVNLNATGFGVSSYNVSGDNYIYIAIRRGPMKVPTDATKVFTPIAASNSGDYVVNAGFPPDMVLATLRDFTSGYNHSFFDRLRGNSNYLKSSATDTESGVIASPTSQIADFSRNQNGIFISSGTVFAYSTVLGVTYAWHNFRRAPSFMDVVCWNGSGSATPATVTHNLGVAPEMIIMFKRGTADAGVQGQVWTNLLTGNRTLYMFSDGGLPSWGNQAPTSVTATTFVSGFFSSPESTSNTFVAYLFATCLGVSKVGQYTGTGSTQTIACGFTGGARFVMVKRTDSTGDWFVWDTARGMVSGTDPSFLLNTTGVEVNANSIYTTTGGFQIVSTAAGINASGGTYLFLAIA
jgi:hypothetical protein